VNITAGFKPAVMWDITAGSNDQPAVMANITAGCNIQPAVMLGL
jgi:hypothetical protein